MSDDVRNIIVESILFNSQSRIEMSDDARYEPDGNATECGLIRFLQMNEYPVHNLVKKKGKRVLAIIPFDSIRKRELFAIRHPDNDDKVRIYLKGAPEKVFDLCSYEINKEGGTDAFEEEKQNELLASIVNREMGQKGERPFAYAYKDMDYDSFMVDFE